MKPRPFRIERFFAPREFLAPYNLCASDCQSWTVAELLDLEEGSDGAFRGLALGYTETAGSPALRQEIARLYTSIEPDDVLVQAGGEEVIFTFMNAVLEPGDHVIVHHPSYQSLRELPAAIGCEVSLWRASAAARWRLDLAELEDQIRPDTRVVVVNFPHNPTGALPTLEEWQRLFALARERDLIVFSDEAYRGLEYQDADRLPAACDMDPDACSLGLVSKGLGLPGLRIGWLATRNSRVLSRIAEFKDYTSLCSSGPSELLATIALRHGGHLLGRNRGIIQRNLTEVRAFFGRHEGLFSWVSPMAGPVTFPTLLGETGVETFCEEILTRSGVLLLPGTVFSRSSNELRLGLGREGFSEALARLEACL